MIRVPRLPIDFYLDLDLSLCELSGLPIMLAAGTSWMRTSPLEVLIMRSCEPSLHEPNYALHLEVAEYINNKKANQYAAWTFMLANLLTSDKF